MQIEWWYWIIAGFCLVGLELIIPSFTIIWFGLGALVVGVFSGVCTDLPLAVRIILWPVVSVCFMLMWHKYLKPKGDRSAGLPTERIIGESGIITRGTEDGDGLGIVKFSIPVRGAEKWNCSSSEPLHAGDRVRVVDIEGQVLKVEII